MKTIEQFKQDLISELGTENEALIRGVVNITLEFAQRWISVEEDLPPVNEEDEWDKEHKYSIRVLVKEQGTVYFGYYYHFTGNWSVQGRTGNIQVTDWKPIELK